MRAKIFILLFFIAQFSFAGDFTDFRSIDRASLKPFAADIGGVMGGGMNYTARSLGFSGFDISFRNVYQFKPSHANKPMHSDRAFGFNFVQAEIGMPYRIDGFIRAGGGAGVGVIGGGIKYGLWKVLDELHRIHGVLVLNSNMANYKDFYAVQFGVQAVFSMNCGNFRPFASLGLDDTRLTVKNANDSSLVDKTVTTLEERYSAGFRWRVKWVNISAAYNLLHDQSGVEGALGIRF